MNEVLKNVVTTVGVLFLGAFLATLLAMFGAFAHNKLQEWKQKVNNDKLKAVIDKLDLIIQMAVEATNQTFVNDIKNGGKLTEEQKKEAFNQTLEAIMQMLSEQDKQDITEQFGDMSAYITNNVEAYIGSKKDI